MKKISSIRNVAIVMACCAGMSAGFLSTSAMAGPALQFGEQGSLTFTYAMQYWMQQKGYTSATDSGSSFDSFLRRNRLTFSGQFDDFIGFYTQLEAGNDSKAGQDNKSVYYRDSYITLDYRDDLRFIVGRFKNTFSRENLEACLEPLTLDRAEVISYTPFGGSRDTGVAVWGNLMDAQLQYRFMIADGREGDVVAKKSPRLTARVHYSLWEPETNYGYLGTYLGTQKVLTIGAAYDKQDNVAYANYPSRSDVKDYKAWTVDAFMEYPSESGVYTLSAATFKYDTGGAYNQTPDTLLAVNSDLKGYYVKGGYMIPGRVGAGRLQFFGRLEKSDYGVTTGTANYYDQKWNSLGANYYLDGQKLKLTAEFAKVTFDTPHPTDPALQDYSQATMGLQFIF
ncbi:MAG: OprO/OprP family phosphate-selective porin [Gammaproteobacteria bacterium]|nr:OprO/OprP family phosphate-selective porin [Gammaproteobacteria bacterium]MBU1775800.1 OprO/OprP family phosphate-selective porin [Gammaproteobacteria bacterium]MBU1968610.1 OprO/OprP family phosphate-selective porin [Gammaproteobacteria bacterium]